MSNTTTSSLDPISFIIVICRYYAGNKRKIKIPHRGIFSLFSSFSLSLYSIFRIHFFTIKNQKKNTFSFLLQA